MYRFLSIFRRDLINLCLSPVWAAYCTLFPFLLVLILGGLCSASYGGRLTSYDYYGLTMIIFIIFNTSTIAANSFMEERVRRGNMRIIYSPVRRADIYLSKTAATFVFAGACHVSVIFLLHAVLGVDFGGRNMGFVIALLLFFELFSSSLGVACCVIFKRESTANQVLTIFINVAALLGGLFFQIDGLGRAVLVISYFSPVKWIFAAAARIIYDGDLSSFAPAALILTFLTAAALLLCSKMFKAEDYI